MAFMTIPGLHVETIDTGHLVLVPGRDDVVHLTGHESEAFELARAGTDTVPDHLAEAMAGLVTLGVVVTSDWSRRKVLQLGGAAAAAGIVTIALPSIAAASSPGGGGTDPGGPTTTEPSSAPLGTIYIANSFNSIVYRTLPGGTPTLFANGTSGLIYGPAALALDGSGNVYISDSGHHRVVKVSPEGDLVGTLMAGRLNNTRGVAVDGAGNVYISDRDAGYDAVWKVDAGDTDGSDATKIIGAPDIYSPGRFAFDTSGNLYVTDEYHNQVVRISAPISATSTRTVVVANVPTPLGVAVDAAGTVYVSYGSVGKVVKVAAGGDVNSPQTVITTALDTSLSVPQGLALDANGNLYIADMNNDRVVILPLGGGDPTALAVSRPVDVVAV